MEDLKCNHIIGLYNDSEREVLVTIDDLIAYQSVNPYYSMKQLLDKRCSTNMFHFDYCPFCGEKIKWNELRKEYSTK